MRKRHCLEEVRRRSGTRPAESIPAFVAAVYGFLQLDGHRVTTNQSTLMLPIPKWYPKEDAKRITTGDLLTILRAQLWGKTNKVNFCDFVKQQINAPSLRNETTSNSTAAF